MPRDRKSSRAIPRLIPDVRLFGRVDDAMSADQIVARVTVKDWYLNAQEALAKGLVAELV